MTLLFTDPLFTRHETGTHPERPLRLIRVWARLEQAGLTAQCRRGAFEPAPLDALGQVHDPAVADRARMVADGGGGFLDADTVVSPESFRVALSATGACLAAVDQVLTGDDRRALCLIRPPGHHATPHMSMGFCLFNNIAIAARHAQTKHGVSRVLIVDWDVHHGNGTQDIFYDDGSVHLVSIHRYGDGFYPGTGAASETGAGAGLGETTNVAVRFGASRRDYLEQFQSAVTKAAERCRPELLLISAGFDAHAQDPIGSLGLETEDYTVMTDFLLDVANTRCGGRVVSCLEGGYNLNALAESVETHLDQMLHFRP